MPGGGPVPRGGTGQHATNGEYYSLGAPSYLGEVRAGDLVFNLEGGPKCHSTFTRCSVVFVKCDEDATAGREKFTFEHEDDDCTYKFTLATKLACPTQPTVDVNNFCQDTPDSPQPLAALASGTSYSVCAENSLYQLNICGPASDSACGGASGACVTLPNGEHKSLGSVASMRPIKQGSGVASLTYTDGAVCADSSLTSMTQISLLCDAGTPWALSFEGLAEHSVLGHCLYQFTLRTCYACSGEDLCTGAPERPVARQTCEGDSANSSRAGGSSGGHGGTIAAVIILLLLGMGFVFVMYRFPAQRARFLGLFRRRAGNYAPVYQYRKDDKVALVSMDSDGDAGLVSEDDSAEGDDDELLPL